MKKEMITVNGKSYQAKEVDFNFICRLELDGIEFSKIDKNYMNLIKSYVAYCMNIDTEDAGKEIEQHLINGGSFNDFNDIITQKMEDSDFFRALGQKKTDESDSAVQKKARKSTAEA